VRTNVREVQSHGLASPNASSCFILLGGGVAAPRTVCSPRCVRTSRRSTGPTQRTGACVCVCMTCVYTISCTHATHVFVGKKGPLLLQLTVTVRHRGCCYHMRPLPSLNHPTPTACHSHVTHTHHTFPSVQTQVTAAVHHMAAAARAPSTSLTTKPVPSPTPPTPAAAAAAASANAAQPSTVVVAVPAMSPAIATAARLTAL